MSPGAIYVDLDGTLAQYDKWRGPHHIGDPVPAMARRVERWLEQGTPVKIFTARVWTDGTPERSYEAEIALAAVIIWCKEHFGVALPVTCVKGTDMIELWDDRAVRVVKNTGEVDRAYVG